MMHFIKNFQPTPLKLIQLGLVLLAALIVLSIAAQFFGTPMLTDLMPRPPHAETAGAYPSEVGYSYASDYADGGYGYATAKLASAPGIAFNGYGDTGAVTLSTRNVMAIKDSSAIAPMPPEMGQTVGDDAEEYEVTDYSATIESHDSARTCDQFMDLKAKDYVVFENSNAYDEGCSFTFKVERTHVQEVLTWIKGLDPQYLTENTRTIKKQIDDFTSEEDILKKKLVEIDDTLKDATNAYADVTRIATQSNDAASLAQIIQGRIQIIQQLTQERININDQLDRLARAKEESLDHLDYTYFYVSVWENPYIDTDQIKESWKQSMRDVVRVINGAIQGVTINLIALFFLVLQYALYALILLVIAKYGWEIAVRIWKK